MGELQERLTKVLLGEGAALVGFADLGRLPENVRDSLPYGISIAVNLNPDIIARIQKGPTRDYHGEYRRVNELLGRLSTRASDIITDAGYRAVASRPTVRSDELDGGLSTPLPHKTVATRAALGWVGKCALLVTRQYGSAIRLATVLTDAPPDVAQPVNESGCGHCRACVDACPAKAPSGEGWTAGLARESFFDATRCHAMARSLAAESGIDETICGICIASCPWTQRYLRTSC